MTSLAQQIEALLFTAGEAVSLRDLAELTHVKEEEVASRLDEINASLLDTGVTLMRTATHAQLVTSPTVAEFLAQFATEENVLSKAALETLSLIAYRGPISRADIDVLRGVDCRRMLRQLLHRGLVRQLRTAGQAVLYDISEECLAHLGVTSRDQLPSFDELSHHEGVDRLVQGNS